MKNKTRKKVLIFVDRWASGGIESFILTFLENVDLNKYDFTIVTSMKESSLFDSRLNRLDIKFVSLLDDFSKWYIRPWKMFVRFIQFNKRNKFEVYHFNIYNALSLLFPVLINTNSKIIIHSHNADVAHDRTRIIKLIIHRLAKLLLIKKKYHLVAVSNLAGKWMFGRKKYIIINNGVSEEKFLFDPVVRNNYREKFNINTNTLVFLNVGRLNEQKNQSMFIDILKSIKNTSLLNFKGIIIGEGPQKKNLELKIKLNNLEDNVSIISGRNDIESIASMSDVFLLPSLYEGLPLVGVEMQSSGLLCFFSSKVDSAIQITDKSFLININESPDLIAQDILEKIASYHDLNREKYKGVININGYGINKTVRDILNIYEA